MWVVSNPEFVRNARGQLRTGRLLAAAVICAAVSIALGFGFSRVPEAPSGPSGWAIVLLQVTLALQALVLAAGGGIACLNSIYKEKEQNTFDFQRLTRLTPWELTVGKLFGAPIFTYFIGLCLLPLAVFAAAMGKARWPFVVAAYGVLIVASIAFHALALLISLLTARGSHTAAIILFLALLGGNASAQSAPGIFRLGPLGPFSAMEIASQTSWSTARVSLWDHWNDAGTRMVDAFFGWPVHHVPVVLVLDLLFAGWFLLAVVRNIKRDPNYYELYSPMQSLGLAMFLNVLFLAFYPLRTENALDAQATLLTLNMIVFLCLGLALLRNRARVRRILRTGEGRGESWLDVAWPAPLVVLGTVAAGLLVVAGVAKGRNPQVDWSAWFAIFRSLFFVAWVARDVQYLQWMSLRRGKHPLVMGVLYLLIFYVCVSVLLGSFGFFRILERIPFTAFFLPTAVYLLDHAAWILRPAIWGSAFVAQWLLVALFMSLQRQAMRELRPRAELPVPAEVPA
jgi:hypothetical protein